MPRAQMWDKVKAAGKLEKNASAERKPLSIQIRQI